MDKDELIKFLDTIEQEVRDVVGDEESMKEQLIDIADSIMKRLEHI
jgi:hypothetical protein